MQQFAAKRFSAMGLNPLSMQFEKTPSVWGPRPQ